MAFNPNQALSDKYEVIHEIKKGGFGIVYYGRDKKLNKPVAIKEIAPNLLSDPKYLDMFQEEALNIAKLSHNNIVHIYELKKVTNGHLYIIMEYIDGIDLEKVIRAATKANRKVPPQLAIYLVSEICMALDYAHQRRDAFTNKPLNLVHQDISPSNIMISRYGGVKLIDFGIASVRRHQSQKKDNKLRGKIPYMAPEQLLMGNHPDQRSDLFSLGLVLYETLTAERLFSAQEEVIAAGKNPKLFRKTIKSKRLPGALSKIILRALEIDISRRYQTANHMYIDLLQYLIACNETGELMDQLADFVGQLFDHSTFPTPTTNFSRPTPYGGTATSPNGNGSETYSSKSISGSGSFWDASDDDEIEIPNVTLDLDQPLVPTVNINTQFQTISTIELDEADDDLKTVIDVVRGASRKNKKKIFRGVAALLTIFLVFAGLDTFKRWTALGMGIYDWLFPPAIEIITIPSRASLSLDGVGYERLTPISIDEISPGVHKLELEHAGYKPIVKSLFVPREGQIRVQGESRLSDNRSYLFRFTTEVQITSNPPGAYVFINGIRFNQQTPCRVAWEVGSPFNLELDHPGFGRISDLALNTIEDNIESNDRRFWGMRVLTDSNIKKYQVQGIFRKDIAFETIPSGVEIFDVETGSELGVTGNGGTISLAAGEHELEFRKGNLIPERRRIVVDEKTQSEQAPFALSRRIRFAAQAQGASDRNDIGATLVEFRSGNRTIPGRNQKTPFEITLPAQSYTAVFDKNGFQRQSVRIGSETQTVNVTMEPTRSVIEVHVIDALTELPISGAEIFYGQDDDLNPESLLGRSDLNGRASGRLLAGRYNVEVKKDGYGTVNKNVLTRRGETHNFVIELYPVN